MVAASLFTCRAASSRRITGQVYELFDLYARYYVAFTPDQATSGKVFALGSRGSVLRAFPDKTCSRRLCS